MHRFIATWICMVVTTAVAAAQMPPAGTVRYLRPAGGGWAEECTFRVAKEKRGWAIGSLTLRGKVQLDVQAEYDEENGLVSGEVILKDGTQSRATNFKRKENKVVVYRGGAQPQSFEVPAGVIVTSAPDWTDTYLLCQRYRHANGGKQTFAALWVHPEQPTQLLKLNIERQGFDMIQHDGKDVKLARFMIELRGKSQYAAWATMDGTMVRLIPLPTKEKQRSGLVLEGFEKSAAADLSPK